jgi:ABC-type ATPase with predicted acetyltransferase domain
LIKKNIAILLIIIILVNTLACYSYQQIKKEKLEKDDKVKITTTNGSVYYLYHVKIQESILKGINRSYDSKMKPDEITIILEDIETFEVYRYDESLTKIFWGSVVVGLVVGIGLVVYGYSQIEK